jgi:hypothetical protein
MTDMQFGEAEELKQNDDDDAQIAEQDEMEYFMREEAERDERQREWAEEAHRAMFRDRDARIDGGLEVTE